MRFPLLVALCSAMTLVCYLPAAAQTTLPQSVVGNGGGEMGGSNYSINGTVGQAVVGIVAGPDNIHQIGFWFPAFLPTIGVADPGAVQPHHFWLGRNYPNPFNPSTTLEYALPEASHVVMKLFDVGGRTVQTLVDEMVEAGFHRVTLNAGDLTSGVYYCRMQAADFLEVQRLVLVK